MKSNFFQLFLCEIYLFDNLSFERILNISTINLKFYKKYMMYVTIIEEEQFRSTHQINPVISLYFEISVNYKQQS